MSMELLPYKDFGDWLRQALGERPNSWLAERLGVKPNYVSMLKSGTQVPKATTLGYIAYYLDGQPAELAEMCNREVVEVEDAYKALERQQSNWLSPSEIMHNLHFQLGVFPDFLSKGMQSPGRELLHIAIRPLQRYYYAIKDTSTITKKHLNDIRILLSDALNHRVWYDHALEEKDRVLTTTNKDYIDVLALVECLEEDGQKNEAKRLGIEAKSLRADGNYIADEWETAETLALEVVADAEEIITIHRSTRALLLCQAQLGKLEEETESRLLDLLYTGKIEEPKDIATTLEAVGRVRMNLGFLDEAKLWFDEVEKLCNKSAVLGKSAPTYAFQAVRGQLGLLAKQESRDLDAVVHLIKEGLSLVRPGKYKRYYSQLKTLAWSLGVLAFFEADFDEEC